MNVCVVGTGYVGLVSGTCFADLGNSVLCVDIDPEKIKLLESGKVPIYEPGLEEIFEKNTREGRLHFTTKLEEGIRHAEIIFLALPTPPADDGSADLKYVLDVANQIGKKLDHYAVVVNKSTVPVGTAKKVHEAIKANCKVDFDVVSNPEFLKEGFAVNDFLNPDRIVVGVGKEKPRLIMEKLYEPLTNNGSDLIVMDERSAEMTKYAANAFLATKISFMNEVANLCELVDANVDMVRQGIGSDPRIGKLFLYPGIGYGGSCFPKDVQALHRTAFENDYDFKLLDAVGEVNAYQKRRIINKILSRYDGDISDKTFALWGLAFKAETDDIREAPSLEIISGLIRGGARVVAYDPEAVENTKRYFKSEGSVTFSNDAYRALDGAEALIVATEWNEFKSPDFLKIRQSLKHPVIFDGRNIYDLDSLEEAGFEYHSIGRRSVQKS